MKPIISQDYSVYFSDKGYQFINEFIKKEKPSSIFLLVDTNTQVCCVSVFLKKIEMSDISIIEIPAGEEYKHIATCTEVWQTLTELGADRKSLLINLGGGVVTDLGGFVASCFKRGIAFINVPTTLLSMVDASVGGKTGVDLGVLKNQIGVFANPKAVVVDTTYLKTLSDKEFLSGTAEIVKHGLIYDKTLFEKVIAQHQFAEDELNQIIHTSVCIKNEVVLKDAKEASLRKVLNYGHTLGHAIESYFLDSEKKEKLTHGEAIAAGMILATYISFKLQGFSKENLQIISKKILAKYTKIPLLDEDFLPILELLQHDKKNVGKEVRFVLLQDYENFVLDCNVSEVIILESLAYYTGLE